jgi:hypothetical protein
MTPEQSPKVKHWEVISHEGTDHAYSWRCIGIGDVIVASSPTFENYGAALADAIRHGFDPTIHHWVNVDKHFTFHFGPGSENPIVISHRDGKYAGPLRRKTDRQAGNTAGGKHEKE